LTLRVRWNIEGNDVAVIYCGDGPAVRGFRATWPAMKPCVAPEKRPSVNNATESPSPAPIKAAVTWSISRIPGRPSAFITNYDNVASFDAFIFDGGEGGFFIVENARGTAERYEIVASYFDDATFRRNIALQDDQAAGRF